MTFDPIDCGPWCVNDPHGYATDPTLRGREEDHLICWGQEHRVPLSRVPPVLMRLNGTYEPEWLAVTATRDRPSHDPYVALAMGERATWVELSPVDAAALRDSLTAALDDLATTAD